MPSVIHFVGGSELAVEDNAGNVVSYLSSGWAEVSLGDGGKAHVNGANVLLVRNQGEPDAFAFKVSG